MNFNEFASEVKQHFSASLGEEYAVTLNEVIKNNNIHLTGLLMKKEGQKVTPNIYLNGFFERYIDGEELEKIKDEIWSTYTDALESFDSEQFDFELEWETQKNFIIYRLVNYKENVQKLEAVPHIRFLDLAITFHAYVAQQEGMISTLPITSQLMEYWGTDVKELMKAASENTKNYLPLTSTSLEEVIQNLIENEQYDELLSVPDNKVHMRVVTNVQGVNGATVMLYEEEFQKLAESMGGKIYILPSSVHEVIILPYADDIEIEILLQLVRQVNETQVPWEDVISYHVYLYQSETRSFEIL